MHVEQRGLAAARGAEQHEELALLDLDVDVLQHLDDRAVGVADDRKPGSGFEKEKSGPMRLIP
jgi:hypothetical protein